MPRASHRILAALLLAGLVLLAHGRGLLGDFTAWDDQDTVAQNPLLGPGTGLRELAGFWSEPRGHIYIPVTYTAWWVVSKVSMSPVAFKLASLAAHMGATLAVWGFARELLRRFGAARPDGPALLGAAVFAVHPLQVESVAWVSGLKDILAGGLAVGALWALLRQRRGVSLGLFIAALLAKPSAVWAVPAGAVLLVALRTPRREIFATLAVAAVPAAIVTMAARWAQPPVGDLQAVPIWFRPVVALDAIAWYVSHVLFPLNLTIDPGRSPQWLRGKLGSTWVLLGGVLLAGLVLALWRSPRFTRLAALRPVAVLLFICALLPNLGLVPFDFQTYSTVADHYAYPAMAAVGLAAAGLAAASRRWTIGLIGLWIVLLAVRANDQGRHWRSSESLFQHAAAVNPTSLAGYNNLAALQIDQGRLVEAAASLAGARRAIEARRPPGAIRALVPFNEGRWLEAKGDPAGAEAKFSEALTLDGGLAEGHFRLGRLLARRGEVTGAERAYLEVVRLDPGHRRVGANLAGLYLARGEAAEAERWARWELERDPASVAAGGNLAAALLTQNKPEARAVAERFTTSPAARNVLGILAARAGDLATAEDHLRAAVEWDRGSGPYQYNLGNVLAARGRGPEAQACWEAALALGYEPARAKLGR